MYSTSLPAWKQLISPTLATRERIPLIESIVSDRDEAEMVGHLRGDDAQAFIDVIYEVSVDTEARVGLSSTQTSAPCRLGIG